MDTIGIDEHLLLNIFQMWIWRYRIIKLIFFINLKYPSNKTNCGNVCCKGPPEGIEDAEMDYEVSRDKIINTRGNMEMNQ